MAEKPVFEAEFTQGLESFARQELKKAGAKFVDTGDSPAGVVRFKFGKSLTRLENLRVVNQLFQIHRFNVPRPKALLGQQHFDRLISLLAEQVKSMGHHNVQSFRLEAAGKDSAVFQRLIAQIEQRLKLPYDPDGGDLFIRFKPATGKQKGWELLVRPSVRPLAVRSWREFNYPGALSAPIAAVMLQMANIQPDDKVLNVMCGSATFQAESEIGGSVWANSDLNVVALNGARVNLKAAGKAAQLQQADSTALPYKGSSFDVIFSDLPWGQLIGESTDMTELYAQTLRECGRVAKSGARLLIITQLKKRFLDALSDTSWELNQTIHLTHDKVTPAVYVLTH